MKISLKWLNDYVELTEYFKKPEVLADVLTRAGLEVESIENKAKDLENVVVGLILEKDKHPNADKLSLCRVTTGQGVVHQIVCGAQNHKTGDRVVVALPGAVLPGNFSIQKSVIRNVESFGMLCSFKELGISEQPGEGIIILPEQATVGIAYSEYQGLNDIIFEIKVTPNRADVLSHFGLARELACLLNRELKTPELGLDKIQSAKKTKSHFSLEVENSELCPRYTGRVIAQIQVQESPLWLKRRLEVLGQKSINNIVDVTNYVLLEMGQPLHAFDMDKIPNKQIRVGYAQAAEEFETLDGTKLKLSGEELAIKDSAHKTLCLAGLIGGKNSGVTENTQNIFLESAYFISHSVRKTSRQLGVETESGYRFSRGVDPEMALMALNRASFLIQQVAGGDVFGDEYDYYPHPVIKRPINISVQTVTQRMGYECQEELLVSWLKRLNCKVDKSLSGSELIVVPPTYRFDLEIDMDIVEEYARLQGYELIPDSLPKMDFQPTAHDPVYINMQKSSQVLRSLGFSQAFNYSFVNEKNETQFFGGMSKLKTFGLEVGTESLSLRNPLNEDLNVMRSSISFGLYKNALENIKYGNDFGKLFEIGKVFKKSGSEITEFNRLGLISWGQKKDLWSEEKSNTAIFSLKEAVETWLSSFRIKSYFWKQIDLKTQSVDAIPECLHNYQIAQLVIEGKNRGFIGTIHPNLMEEEKIRLPMAIAEVSFDEVLINRNKPFRVHNIARYPIVERDLALVMAQFQPVDEITKVIKKISGNHLLEISIFDVYEGDKLPVGQKSVALRMRFQDSEKNLEEAVINQYQEQILKKLNEQFQVSLR